MSNTPPSLHHRNLSTQIGSISDLVSVPKKPEALRGERIMAEAAYSAALELRWSKRVDAPGAWLVVHRYQNEWRGEVLESTPWSALTLGRHDQCVSRLDSKREVSLRHLLVRRLAEGGPGEIEVLDLRSKGGARVVRGGKRERMALRGPVVLLASGQPVAIVPMDGQLPDSIPEPDVVNTMPKPSTRGRSELSSFSSFGTLGGAGPMRTQDPQRGALTGWFHLINDRGQKTELAVYDDDLERGILLGRYQRCDLRVGKVDLPNSVSRVHAFVVGDGDGVRVYDTASTNGIGVGPRYKERLPCLRFGRGYSFRFWLGADIQLRWQPV